MSILFPKISRLSRGRKADSTPIMRVVVSIVVFALERDRLFVAITVLVLAILLVSNFLLGTMGAHGMRNEKHQP